MRKSAQRFAEASIYLERATTIRPSDLAARKLLASLRLQTGKVEEAVAHARGDRRRRRPTSSRSTCSSRPPTTGSKRKEDAQRERAIVDRLNAEPQAKQKGGVMIARDAAAIALGVGAWRCRLTRRRCCSRRDPRRRRKPAAKPPRSRARPPRSIGWWSRRPRRAAQNAGTRRSRCTPRP